MWFLAACGSALFAGVTAILAKLGVRETDSDLVTALRTVVVLAFAWLMVAVVGSAGTLSQVSARSMAFLGLSGLATGASWICYFRALSLADVSRVAPIDKSSTALSVLLAVALLGETEGLVVKLAGTGLLLVGTLLMTVGERGAERAGDGSRDRRWAAFAVLSAVFAALTSILAKVGVDGVESNLATALRTCVVLVMAWAIVLARGKQRQLAGIDRREAAFIALSAVATGASWLCYYYAIQTGPVSAVVPIDRLSILVTMAFSALVLHERMGRRELAGLALMVAGTLVVAVL